MVQYKYSLIEDVKFAFQTWKTRKHLRNIGVAFWQFNPLRWLWLMWHLLTKPFPEVSEEKDIVCWLRSSGPWGMYHPEDHSISINPWKIEHVPGGMSEVIRHEVIHLQHPETDEWEHEEKEAYIEQKQQESA